MTIDKPTDSTRDVDAFLATLRDRFRLAQEAIEEIHKEALEDFKFRLGEQWDAQVLQRRKQDGRPCYVVNRIPQFVRQVTGEQKKNRPAIQISPIGDGADIETAEIEQGLVRHIERTSDADEAYDTAFDHAVTGGFGYFRLLTDYVDDEGLDQEIRFAREPNPWAHYPDPRAKKRDYSDARFWLVVEQMPREDYERDYPASELAGLNDFSSVGDRAPGWLEKDSVRVAEYFWIEESTETIRKGQRSREKRVRKVCWCKTNGIEILEQQDIPGEYIPIVPVLGEELIVDGKRHLIGLVRFARTPQQLYNMWQSAMAESIALAPKAPFLATPAQVEGYEDTWDDALNSNYSYLPYNPDPKAPGPPQRQAVEAPIQAITEALAHADNDLKSTTGLYDPSLGAPGPEQSGKAILLRQKQGENSSFGFVDAMATAIRHAGRIILGWIPHYYDAARVVRVVNPDGTSKTVHINQPFVDDDGLRKVFDLTVGKYDVAVSTGPSYQSMRQEAADSMLQLVQANPALMQVVGDLLVSNFDWPMADEIAERLKKLLPPQLQDQAANALPQAQAQLAQAHVMIQQLTAAVNKLSEEKIAKMPELATKERIALLQAKAQIFAAALKAKSTEALALFHADIEQIDRQLALMPDPGAQTVEVSNPGVSQPPQQANVPAQAPQAAPYRAQLQPQPEQLAG